ncbi:RNA exonuclease 1 [Rhizoctonia solani]|uniref:RNA exonuclease 1 n=1 Tax=Rhizoctonia solani TaxID=456999 RepID=A0A8H8P7Z5_9AGAM|nr:RNA exonuclease 1 [Rhizoctonia solani]QRW27214.1 RNA exonuclease 1 [Rhizoctonia solani]
MAEVIAINTQYVGIGAGGSVPMLARVSFIDYRGHVVYDKFVIPSQPGKFNPNVRVSHQTNPQHFSGPDAVSFSDAQAMAAHLLRGRIVVGHSLWLDLQVLGVSHPACDTRDVGLYLPFRSALKTPNQVIGLQTLVWQLMRRKIQEAHHNPVENARAAMDLFRSHEAEKLSRPVNGHVHCPPRPTPDAISNRLHILDESVMIPCSARNDCLLV